MTVNIEVDELKFKDIIEQELKAFSKEELHDIIKEVIIKYLNESDVIRNIFVKDEYDRWTNMTKKVPTDFLTSIVKSIDLSESCDSIKDKLTDTIKNNATEIISRMFIRSICSNMYESWMKTGELESIILSTTNSMRNRG